MGILRRLSEWRETASGTLKGSSFEADNATISSVDANDISNKDYNETVVTHSSVSGTVSIDLAASNHHVVKATGNVTISFTNVSSNPNGNSVLLYFTDDDNSGPHTISWPSSVVWDEGSAETSIPDSSNIEIGLVSSDGGTEWRGRRGGQKFA